MIRKYTNYKDYKERCLYTITKTNTYLSHKDILCV